MTDKTPLLSAALAGLIALGGAALAQGMPEGAMAADPNKANPFNFAQSDAKEIMLKEQMAAAEASGGRVIGGEVAEDGAWPWQVALMVAGQPTMPDAQFCGGSMVLDTWVLTAAHCIYMDDGNGNFFQLQPGQFDILVGTNTLADGQGERVPVAGVFRHPEYDTRLFDNDIALIKLAHAPSVAYQTINVPDTDFGEQLDQQGIPTIVTGWGLVNGAKRTEAMMQAEIQVISRDACNNAMMEARAGFAAPRVMEAAGAFQLDQQQTEEVWSEMLARAPLPLSPNMICSGTFEGGKTSCQGDSGGPLVVPLNDGSYIQAGVVSWGLVGNGSTTCAEDAYFSVYTKASKFVPWLNQTVSTN
ncbi:serine protease [Marinovum sp.]|uniref:serine protease n=1 Tax=Marinovum sp. TaxID=2024839 RepID=UPI003A94BF6C